MNVVRRVGALALVVAAVGVWFGLNPTGPTALDHGSPRADIESTDSANNARAEGAPQQTVVNGWTTNDYLALLSTQLDEASAPPEQDLRPAAMLGLCVVGIALIALTSPSEP